MSSRLSISRLQVLSWMKTENTQRPDFLHLMDGNNPDWKDYRLEYQPFIHQSLVSSYY
jgi:hypothetical protein